MKVEKVIAMVNLLEVGCPPRKSQKSEIEKKVKLKRVKLKKSEIEKSKSEKK